MCLMATKGPTFRQILIRQQVLQLYRESLRVVRQAPADQRAEMRRWIRHEFDLHRDISDEKLIKSSLLKGKRSLTDLRKSLCLASN